MFMDKTTDVCRLGNYAVGLADTVLIIMKIWLFMANVTTSCFDEYELFSDKKHTKEQIVELIVDQVAYYLTDTPQPDIGDRYYDQFKSHVGKLANEHTTLLNANPYAKEYMMRDNKVHLKEYVKAAFDARFVYEENKQYVIQGKEVVIQDPHTGQSMFKSQWRNGMHQFLQLKHGVPIVKETLDTNMMSYKFFFKRYHRLFGVTGTLGNARHQAFLASLFQPLWMMCVPSNYEPGRLEYPAIRTVSEAEQLRHIIAACRREVKEQRPVLVICENIKFATHLSQQLKSCGFKVMERILDSGNNDTDIQAGCGDIIVATNLLGRGADIDLTKEAEESGGLHVIVTFTSQSIRVLLQALGRCARKWLLGTAQVIDVINCAALREEDRLRTAVMPHATYVDQVYQPEIETQHFNKLKEDIALIDAQEAAFRRYQDLVTGSYGAKKKIPEIFTQQGKVDANSPIFRALEERWAVYFRQYRNDAKKLKEQFASEISCFADSDKGSAQVARRALVLSSGLQLRLVNQQTVDGCEDTSACQVAAGSLR